MFEVLDGLRLLEWLQGCTGAGARDRLGVEDHLAARASIGWDHLALLLVAELGESLSLEDRGVLLVENVDLSFVLGVHIVLSAVELALIRKCESAGGRLDASYLADDTLSIWAARHLLLENSLALFLKLVEVPEVSLSLPENEELFSLVLNPVWVLLIDGEIGILIFIKA